MDRACGATRKRRTLSPNYRMEVYVKKLLLGVLLIIGVAGCATYPLTAQQKEAIDYQNHKPYTT